MRAIEVAASGASRPLPAWDESRRHGMERRSLRALTLSLALAVGGVGPARAQEPSAESQPPTAVPAAATAVPAAAAETSDLWMLTSQQAVTRFDGRTGQVVAQLDVTTEGCLWERLVGPSEGSLWLMTERFQADEMLAMGLDVEQFCIGRFPLDGSGPQIVAWDPRSAPGGATPAAMVQVEDAVALDGALWLSVFESADPFISDDDFTLRRLRDGSGIEPTVLETVAPLVAAVGLHEDGLVVGKLPKPKRAHTWKAVWRPATLAVETGDTKALKAGLKKKETFRRGILTGGGLIAFVDDERFVLRDTVSGKTVRPKVHLFDRSAQLVLTPGAAWVSGIRRAGGALQVVPTDSGKPEAVVECDPLVMDFGGTCPILVGSTPGAVWFVARDGDPVTGQLEPLMLSRLDVSTREVTAQVDISAIMESDSQSLRAAAAR